MTKLCICQICKCGRHHCPHQPHNILGKGDKPCRITEYNNKYQPHPLEKVESFKPQAQAAQSTGPLDDKTTHRVDYIPHPVHKPALHEGDPYVTPDGHFDHLTSYTKDYPVKEGQRAVMKPRDDSRRDAGRFEGEPTYKSDYRKWQIKPTSISYHGPAWHPPQGKFAGKTSYYDNYIRHNQGPRETLRPAENAKHSDGPFDDHTCYKDDYIRHPMELRERRAKEAYNPNKAPLDGLTTFKRDFTPKDARPVESMKPAGNAYISDAPFEGKTTHKSDYTQWQLDKPYHHAADPYTKPPGDIDFRTTHNVVFTPKEMTKRGYIRPQSRGRAPGEFDGNTNYKQDFVKWPIDRQRALVQERPYVSKGKFEGLPTYKAHYIRHPAANTLSCRPDVNAMHSGDPFDDHTMYRSEYVPKIIEPCPANPALLNNSGRFAFVEQTAGHKWYAPASETITELRRPQNNSQTLQPLEVA
ncbi:stabilizer of axonemal microtubules 2-like isoform X2 [Lineus longissimus]|uniref:stabilizer of axonemal microtubules 2-like isoform X2 n=1 Tax=Lineus longissimus TaxID=88925 RepID=UPI002B4E1C09